MHCGGGDGVHLWLGNMASDYRNSIFPYEQLFIIRGTDKFIFLGFPPQKKGRQTYFQNLQNIEQTTCFYESNHRILKAITSMQEFLEPETKICICRELTKKFETIYRGTVGGLADMQVKDKGEFVIIISK